MSSRAFSHSPFSRATATMAKICALLADDGAILKKIDNVLKASPPHSISEQLVTLVTQSLSNWSLNVQATGHFCHSISK